VIRRAFVAVEYIEGEPEEGKGEKGKTECEENNYYISHNIVKPIALSSPFYSPA